jgi:hypothetical protein
MVDDLPGNFGGADMVVILCDHLLIFMIVAAGASSMARIRLRRANILSIKVGSSLGGPAEDSPGQLSRPGTNSALQVLRTHEIAP